MANDGVAFVASPLLLSQRRTFIAGEPHFAITRVAVRQPVSAQSPRRAHRLRACQQSDAEDSAGARRGGLRVPPISRRGALQLINALLGAATLAVLVRMGNTLRFMSPRTVLASLGLSNVPSRAARAAEAETAVEISKEMAGVTEFVKRAEARAVPCPAFPRSADWINSRPLSLSKELQGKVVLLDFWTSCCINCQHVLPKLAKLEKKYGEDGSGGVVVVGVHSAKFPSERQTANVAAAVEKFEVQHPVVNDVSMEMWNNIGITSWPSLALVSPRGSLLALWSGENQERDIDACITASLQYYKDEIDHRPLPAAPPRSSLLRKVSDSPLRYPSKLVTSPDGTSVFVADTGNHRIVRLDMKTGAFLSAYGSGTAGFEDAADPSEAKFQSPQGLAMRGDQLWVCDTENHAVRLVNTTTGSVSTIGGNGKQGFDYGAGRSGKAQVLSSPWDAEVDTRNGRLYIAMAGIHQIWFVDLKDDGEGASPWKVFSGTGRELEKNSSVGRNAGWAQPSHLSLDQDGDSRVMWIADSESSSVRGIQIDPPDGNHPTRTLAGGDGLFAENLFAFGDKDGRGSSARLQHPLAVQTTGSDGRVFCADTYNHKIKEISRDGVVTTLAGDGKPGFADGKGKSARFWEPSGLALSPDGASLWVADSNNYAIRTIDLSSRAVSTVKLSEVPEPKPSTQTSRLVPNRRRTILLSENGSIPQSLSLKLELPPKAHFTEGTVSRWQVNEVTSGDGAVLSKLAGGDLKLDKASASASTSLGGGDRARGTSNIEVEAVVFYCTDQDNVCRTESVVWQIAVDPSGPILKELEHTVRSRRPAQSSRMDIAIQQ